MPSSQQQPSLQQSVSNSFSFSTDPASPMFHVLNSNHLKTTIQPEPTNDNISSSPSPLLHPMQPDQDDLGPSMLYLFQEQPEAHLQEPNPPPPELDLLPQVSNFDKCRHHLTDFAEHFSWRKIHIPDHPASQTSNQSSDSLSSAHLPSNANHKVYHLPPSYSDPLIGGLLNSEQGHLVEGPLPALAGSVLSLMLLLIGQQLQLPLWFIFTIILLLNTATAFTSLLGSTIVLGEGIQLLFSSSWFLLKKVNNSLQSLHSRLHRLSALLQDISSSMFSWIPRRARARDAHNKHLMPLIKRSLRLSSSTTKRKRNHQLTTTTILQPEHILPKASSSSIPIKILNHLPFIFCSKNLPMMPPFLLDTGSAVNIIPKTSVDKLENYLNINFDRYVHSSQVSSHSNNSLNLHPDGVILPLPFTNKDGQTTTFSIPFLQELDNDRTAIIGFPSLSQLSIGAHKTREGTLHIDLQQDSPEIEQLHSTTMKLQEVQVNSLDAGTITLPRMYSMYCGLALILSPSDPSLHDRSCETVHLPQIGCHLVPALRESLQLQQQLKPFLQQDPLLEWGSSELHIPLGGLLTEVVYGQINMKKLPPEMKTTNIIIQLLPKQEKITKVCSNHVNINLSKKKLKKIKKSQHKSSPPPPSHTGGSAKVHQVSPNDENKDNLTIQTKQINEAQSEGSKATESATFYTSLSNGSTTNKKKPNSSLKGHTNDETQSDDPSQSLHDLCRSTLNDEMRNRTTSINTDQNKLFKGICQLSKTTKEDTLHIRVINLLTKTCILCTETCTCFQPPAVLQGLNPSSVHTTFTLPDEDLFTPSKSPIIENLTALILHHQTKNIQIGPPDNLSSQGIDIRTKIMENLSQPIHYSPNLLFTFLEAKPTSTLFNATNHINTCSTPPQQVQAEKDQQYAHGQELYEEDLEPVDLRFTCQASGDLQSDLNTALSTSDPAAGPIIRHLTKMYKSAVSSAPEDIGCFKNPQHILDLSLLEGDLTQLPKDAPFRTSHNAEVAGHRILSMWEQAGIIKPSNIRSHGSRLVIAPKNVGKQDRIKIRDRLLKEHQIDIDISSMTGLLSIDPSLLELSEINKIYRSCLDSRSLNKLTLGTIQISPNPETTFYDLLMNLGPATKDNNCTESLEDIKKKFQPPRSEELTYPWEHPLPTPSDSTHLNTLLQDFNTPKDRQGGLWITSLDLRSAHQSVQLSERSSFLLNFVVPGGLFYQFLRSPFGINQISSHFNSAMMLIFADLISKGYIILYADDLILITRTRLEHVILLAEVFRRLSFEGIKLSINKCHFLVQTFKYLGHIFGPDGVKLSDQRVRGLLDLQKPKDIKGVQRIVGSFIYIKNFIPNLADHLAPLTDLVGKKKFLWEDIHQIAFDNLKRIISASALLNYIDRSKPLHLYVDSSQRATGAILFQGEPNSSDKKPILFLSRKFTSLQSKTYNSFELEACGLIDTLIRIEYLIESGLEIQVHTDCKTVLFLLSAAKKGNSAKLCRLVLRLAQFPVKYNVQYCKPSEGPLAFADMLSRQHDSLSQLRTVPTKIYRQITADHINHTIPMGTLHTLESIMQLYQDHPEWVQLPADENINPGPHPLQLADVAQQVSGHGHPFYLEETSLLHSHSPDINTNTDEMYEYGSTLPLPSLNNHQIKLVSNTISTQVIAEHQRASPEHLEIKDFFLHNPDAKEGDVFQEHWTMKSGLILYCTDPNNIAPETTRIWIPTSLLPTLIIKNHISFGHLGFNNINKILQHSYYSKPMKRKCEEILKSCHFCQVFNPSTLRQIEITGFFQATSPMDQLAIDHATFNPHMGKKSLLAVVDVFSGFLWCFPLPNESAEHVVTSLESIFSLFGRPRSIKSDNSLSLLKSSAVQQLLSKYDIVSSKLSLPHSPRHNSNAEISIKSIRKVIRTFTQHSAKAWSNKTKAAVLILNTTPRNYGKTTTTPFELFLRRKPFPNEANTRKLFDSNLDNGQVSSEEILSLQRNVNKHVADLKKSYQAKFNKTTRANNIEAGDLVLLKRLNPPKAGEMALKIGPAYHHRLFIVHDINGLSALIEDIATRKTLLVNANHLKLYHTRKEYFDQLPPDLRKEVGNSFSLNPTLETRLAVLQKLDKEGFNSANFVFDVNEDPIPEAPILQEETHEPAILSKVNKTTSLHSSQNTKTASGSRTSASSSHHTSSHQSCSSKKQPSVAQSQPSIIDNSERTTGNTPMSPPSSTSSTTTPNSQPQSTIGSANTERTLASKAQTFLSNIKKFMPTLKPLKLSTPNPETIIQDLPTLKKPRGRPRKI